MTDGLTIRLKALISRAFDGLFNRFGFQCSISLFLCFSICYDGWINFSLVIDFFIRILNSTSFSLKAAVNLVIRLRDSILEALYHLLNRLGF